MPVIDTSSIHTGTATREESTDAVPLPMRTTNKLFASKLAARATVASRHDTSSVTVEKVIMNGGNGPRRRGKRVPAQSKKEMQLSE
jgi:hypothetical protein